MLLKYPRDMLSDLLHSDRETEGLSEMEPAVIYNIILEVVYHDFFPILLIKCESHCAAHIYEQREGITQEYNYQKVNHLKPLGVWVLQH